MFEYLLVFTAGLIVLVMHKLSSFQWNTRSVCHVANTIFKIKLGAILISMSNSIRIVWFGKWTMQEAEHSLYTAYAFPSKDA
jgi:hypothetical protein